MKDVLKIGCGITLAAGLLTAVTLAGLLVLGVGAGKVLTNIDRTVESMNCANSKTQSPSLLGAAQTRSAELAIEEKTPNLGLNLGATDAAEFDHGERTQIAGDLSSLAHSVATAQACVP